MNYSVAAGRDDCQLNLFSNIFQAFIRVRDLRYLELIHNIEVSYSVIL